MRSTQKESTNQPIVMLNKVSKSFGSKKVIDSFSMTIYRGEFVAITGRSGSEKSTLLNLIGLLDKADQGTITLFGKPSPTIGSSGARNLLRNKLGYLFQNAALIDQDTVEANLKTAQKYSQISKSQQANERKSALKLVGLADMEKQKVYELSGGEQQRLAVACLLMHPSELILADEPTGSLDPDNRDVVLVLLQSLRKQGKTILVVTHDSAVASMADRIVSLNI